MEYAGLRHCPACTHVWADLSISSDEIRRLYQRSYFFGDEYANYLDDRRIIEKNFAARLATLRRFLTASHLRLFEIGCAYGLFLNLARDTFDAVHGIDVSEDAVNFAVRDLGLDVTCGDLLDADLSGQTFDVACLWDTIEHLAEPRKYLEKIAPTLRQGARLAITTGDIGSLNARIQKGRWRLIHPPTHLQYFTRTSLSRLLDACGFRVLHVEYCGFYRSIGGMLHNLVALRWKMPRAGSWLGRALPAGADVYLNLNDIMYVIAERR
jgi:2-polyprenyl-3-methyl-5-hydroxy-6-metoxy-1,4-benzoquinol methylase